MYEEHGKMYLKIEATGLISWIEWWILASLFEESI